jgi:hypothetical protein
VHVIAIPDTDRSKAVLDCLLNWSGAGLIEPFVWWPLCATAGNDVLLIEAGQTTPGQLGPVLEGRGVSGDLIGLHASGAGEAIDAGFAEHLHLALERLRDVVRFDATRPTGAFMVVAPGALAQPIPTAIFHPRTVNVYVAPESRRDPDEPNLLTDLPDLADGHAAHAAACLCELWVGQTSQKPSVLGRLRTEQGGNGTYVQVVQCYTRMIHGGFLADHVAARVLRLGAEWPNPAPVSFDRVTDSAVLDPLWDYVIDEYFVEHRETLDLSDFEPIVYEEPRYKLWAALKIFFAFLIERLRRAPIDWIRRTAAEKIDRIVIARVERLTGLKIERVSDVDESTTQMIERVSKRPFTVPNGSVGPAWIDLRSMSLGFVDGSPLPVWIDESACRTNDEQRIVVPNPALIVPDPRLVPPVSIDGSTEPLRACDPLRLTPGLVVPTPPDGDASGSPAAAGGPPRSSDEGLGHLVEFIGPLEPSLVWRVGLQLAHNLRTSEAESIPPETRTDEERKAADDERVASEKRIRRGFLRTAAVTTAVAVVASWFELKELALVKALIALAGTGVLWFVILTVVAFRSLRRVRAGREAQVELDLAEMNAALKAVQRRGDAIRLTRRYNEYLDWAEIIGWCAYRPWVARPADTAAGATALDQSTLPPSLTVGAGVITEPTLDRLQTQASNVVFQPRWLTHVFDAVHRSSRLRFAIQSTTSVDPDDDGSGLPDIALDTTTDKDSPRQHLLRALRAGDDQRVLGDAAGAQVLDFLRAQVLDEVFAGVRTNNAEDASSDLTDGALAPTAGWLDTPPELARLAADARPSIVRVHNHGGESAGSGVIVSREGVVATNRHVVEGDGPFRVVLDDERELEAHLLRRSDSTDLALLQLPDGTYPCVGIEADEVVQGQPIFSIGHPLMQQGDPTLTFGLVAAPHRQTSFEGLDVLGQISVIQTTYPSAPGASGSPVFDLTGHVVGIHCGQREHEDRDADYMTFAVPASDLLALIAGAAVPLTDDLAEADLRALVPTERFFQRLAVENGQAVFLPDHWSSNGGDCTVPAWAWGLERLNQLGHLRWSLDFQAPARVGISVGHVARQVPVDQMHDLPSEAGR